jgi:tetratricopeptide (TPR) repeat protein
MREPDKKTDLAAIADQIAQRIALACDANRPLFLIVHYEHEAIKTTFIGRLQKVLAAMDIDTQAYNPGERPEHGAGRLYPLLARNRGGKSVALITDLPRQPEGTGLDPFFLDYLNLHRDLISKQCLRLVLFIHVADASAFMAGAGDFWDFRHHSFWLEGRAESERTSLWETREWAPLMTGLAEDEKRAVDKHLEDVHALVETTSDPTEKASLLLDLSRWLFRRNLFSLAADAAFAGLDRLDDTPTALRASMEFALGHALRKIPLLGDALTHYRKALAIRREIGDRDGEGTTLNNISQIFDAWGLYDEALKTLQESLAISREIGDRDGEGVTLNNIALIYKAWGRYDEALKTLQESLAIRREIGDRAGEGTNLNNIASIYKAWGRYDEALKTLQESLAISREIGDRVGEGATLNNISQIYDAWGRYDEALKTLQESLAIRREIGDRAGEGTTLNNISQIYDAWGRYDEALKTLQESLAIRREIGDRAGEGTTLNNIAMIYKAWGRYDEALKTLQESLAIRREIGDRDGEGTTLNNISQIYDAWGRYDEALKTLQESLAISREIGDRAGEGVTCWNLALEYERRGEIGKAREYALCTVKAEEEASHPDLEKSRKYLQKLEESLESERTPGTF